MVGLKMVKKKILFDLVHGYIEIDEAIEAIIDCESFQRLKFISQLTAQSLYPSANHTRFEHSLGVMYLSVLFFNRIIDELQIIIKNKQIELLPPDDIDFLKNHLQFAALLHDVGHAPLSHVGEHLYNKNEIIEKLKEEHIKHSIPNKIPYLEKHDSQHELMSCYVIIKNFREILNKLYPKINYDFLYRIITGAKYDKDEYPERNVIISIVNSQTFDVDKLDYLLRDNFMTGKVGPEIDIPRLLMALTINKDNEIAFTHVALSALQKVIDCKDNVYMWVCNHHTVVYTDYLYQECFKHFDNLYKLQEKDNKKYIEALPISELFSYQAISDRCVDDNDALHFIRSAMWYVKDNRSESNYSKNILMQLENRHYLKPTWKTLFEYTKYIDELKTQFGDKIKEGIIKYVTDDENNRSRIVHYICKNTHIELGKLFVIVRKNKFYCEKMDGIYILINDKEEKLSKLLPPRNYRNLYDSVAFYIFCDAVEKENVKEQFKKYFDEHRKEI
jgi:HD superfamily phosphohydrolase